MHAAAAVLAIIGRLATTALDTIDFAAPLPRHHVSVTNGTIVVQPDATADCRRALQLDLSHGGRVLFDMAVDPTRRTHITVKYWGGLGLNGSQPFLGQQNTWLLDPTDGSYRQHGWAHSWPCELDQSDPVRGSSIDGPFPNRWQYVTYPLPAAWTAGQTTLRIGLGTGLFQW